jgi:hypothetical protein
VRSGACLIPSPYAADLSYERLVLLKLGQPGTEIRTAGLVNRRGLATPLPNKTLILAPVAHQSGPIFVQRHLANGPLNVANPNRMVMEQDEKHQGPLLAQIIESLGQRVSRTARTSATSALTPRADI